jgi:hypothetical protein
MITNATPEEVAARKAELKKQRECPTCGADREAMGRMRSFEQSIVEHIRTQQLVLRDSCIQCVEKHLGKAMVLYKELLTAAETNNVAVELNHLEIIGNQTSRVNRTKAVIGGPTKSIVDQDPFLDARGE